MGLARRPPLCRNSTISCPFIFCNKPASPQSEVQLDPWYHCPSVYVSNQRPSPPLSFSFCIKPTFLHPKAWLNQRYRYPLLSTKSLFILPLLYWSYVKTSCFLSCTSRQPPTVKSYVLHLTEFYRTSPSPTVKPHPTYGAILQIFTTVKLHPTNGGILQIFNTVKLHPTNGGILQIFTIVKLHMTDGGILLNFTLSHS